MFHPVDLMCDGVVFKIVWKMYTILILFLLFPICFPNPLFANCTTFMMNIQDKCHKWHDLQDGFRTIHDGIHDARDIQILCQDINMSTTGQPQILNTTFTGFNWKQIYRSCNSSYESYSHTEQWLTFCTHRTLCYFNLCVLCVL